jgi:hypothetical protein
MTVTRRGARGVGMKGVGEMGGYCIELDHLVYICIFGVRCFMGLEGLCVVWDFRHDYSQYNIALHFAFIATYLSKRLFDKVLLLSAL